MRCNLVPFPPLSPFHSLSPDVGHEGEVLHQPDRVALRGLSRTYHTPMGAVEHARLGHLPLHVKRSEESEGRGRGGTVQYLFSKGRIASTKVGEGRGVRQSIQHLSTAAEQGE